MNIQDERDWVRLARYVAGEGDERERQATTSWIEADAARRQLAAELEAVWEATGAGPHTDPAAGWKRLAERLNVGGAEPSAARSTSVRQHRPWKRSILAMAAGVVALLGAYLFLQPGPDTGAAAFVAETGVGEREGLSLPDGSRVVLNPMSRLEVAAGFGRDERVVSLSGAAFFDVAEDSLRPFLVDLGVVTLRVLGTEFAVSAYDGAAEAHVVVASGRVAVRPGGQPMETRREVGPAQRATVDRAGGFVTVDSADLDDYLLEQQGRVVLRSVPLARALEELQRWYDVKLEVTDPVLADRRITATFEFDPLGDVLHAIAMAVDATYSVEGRTVRFERATD